MSLKGTQSRYGPVAVLLHWASAILILVLLVTGFRSGYATDPQAKIAALRVHLPVAGLVLVLTAARLLWWWRADRKPGPLDGVPG